MPTKMRRLTETLAHRVSAANREHKWQVFVEHMDPRPSMRVLDVGFSETEYSPSDNYIEKHYPYPENLVALGVDSPTGLLERYPRVSATQYEGTHFPFADSTFDICWSNAVIEHVGDKASQVYFVKEMSRVAERLFFTTPNRLFPVEVHTRTPLLHFLPKSVFNAYLRLVRKGWATGDYMNLLSQRQLQHVLREAGIVKYSLVKNRLFGFVMDFIVIADCSGSVTQEHDSTG